MKNLSSDPKKDTLRNMRAYALDERHVAKTQVLKITKSIISKGLSVFVVTSLSACGLAILNGEPPSTIDDNSQVSTQYLVEASASNVAISPSVAQRVRHGDVLTYTITANTGYTLSNTVGGTCPTEGASWNGNSYTTGAITSDCNVLFGASINSYSVTYHPTGSTSGSAPDTQNANYNSTITLANADSLVRTGYSFSGWNTEADGSGTDHAAASNYTVTANLTLYPKWTINAYTVSSSGTNVSIDPTGERITQYNTTLSYTVTADNGLLLTKLISGDCPRGSWNGDVYTTGDITANCSVYFSAEVDNGTTCYPTFFSGGFGTAEDPFLVSTPEQLQIIGSRIDCLSQNFELTADIDMSAYDGQDHGNGFNPTYNIIGGYNASFSGSFDGNGHVISNVRVSNTSTDYVGVFGYLQGNITDLGAENVNITGQNYVGGLVGFQDGGIITNSYATGTVSGNDFVGGLVGGHPSSNSVISITGSYSTSNVSSSGYLVGGLIGAQSGSLLDSYATGDVYGGYNVGGLAGQQNGNITGSHALGAVTGTGDWVGGLVGYQSEGITTNSYSSGTVLGAGDYVGGLVGYQVNGSLVRSYTTGTVTALGSAVGGLVGVQNGDIERSYATGGVSGMHNVGGLVGYQNGLITNSFNTGEVFGAGDYVGGLVGYKFSGSVTSSYATGAVNGAGNFVGGLIGDQGGGSTNSSFWDKETTNQESSAGEGDGAAMGRTTAQMQIAAPNGTTYTGWDTNIWNFSLGQYPTLK